MLYNVVLVSAIQQHESAISFMCTYTHLPPSRACLPLLSHPSGPSQDTALCCLGYAAASHLLIILHMIMCMCQCCSLSVSYPLLPPPCPLHLSLHSFPTNRLISTVSRFHTYALTYDTRFSLYTRFTLCN